MQKRQIFRQVALERLSSPEQLDQLMQVIAPAGWAALAALAALLVTGVLWGIFGSLPSQVVGSCTLASPGDSLPLRAVVSVSSPEIDQIQTGMDAQVLLPAFNQETYGYIQGRVISVDRSASMATVNLLKNPNTPSGYAWSSRQGPAEPLSAGMPCEVRIIIFKHLFRK